MNDGSMRLPRQSQLFFLGLLALLVFLTWLVFKPFVIFMITGVFVAVLALPLDRRLEKRLPNRLAAVATILVLFLVLTVPLVLLGFALINDAADTERAIREGVVDDAIEAAVSFVYPGQTEEERNATLENVWNQVEPRVEAALQRLAGNLIGFVGDLFVAVTIILFVVYYMLVDGHQLVAYIKRVAPLPQRQVDFLLAEARTGLYGVFVGQILTSLIQGTLGGIGFVIAGVENAVLWAAVMAVLSLLPVVGAFLVWVPAALFLLVTGNVWQAVFLVAWGVIVVSQVDNFIRPKLIGNRARIHPVFVLVGVLGGVAAFGFIGLFLGPLLVGVTLSVLRVWESDYLDPTVGREDPTIMPTSAPAAEQADEAEPEEASPPPEP